MRAIILAGGIFYVLVGLSLLLIPTWFFYTIGNFPPFNRHYMGDLGSFSLPIGAGLIIAFRNPIRHFGILNVVIAANLLHAINHIYDAMVGHESLPHSLGDTAPLIVFAGIFWWAAWRANKEERI